MIKLGVIFLAYEQAKGLYDRLMPFQRDNIIISAVHAVFPEYHKQGFPIYSRDGTDNKLKELQDKGLIKYLKYFEKPAPESEVRDFALQTLKRNEDCTHFLILDGDESFIDKDVSGLLKFVEQNQDIAWFSINFKNLVFDQNHYLDNFSPPRVFKNIFNNGRIIECAAFHWDNDIWYLSKDGITFDYKNLPTKTISRNICFPLHDSWRSIPRSKSKILYQQKHFNGICSYRWNEEKDCLEFNPEFYKNQPYPEVFEQ